MLPYANMDDLIDAVRALTPNPVMEIIIPTVTGIVGVATGFILSTLTEMAARKRARAEAHRAAIEAGRRPAANALLLHMEWAISNFENAGVQQIMPSKIDEVIGVFAATGRPDDIQIMRQVRELLDALNEKLKSFKGFGAYGPVWMHTPADIDVLHGKTAQVAELANRWVEDRESSHMFGIILAIRAKEIGK